jgi:hypothetical protein
VQVPDGGLHGRLPLLYAEGAVVQLAGEGANLSLVGVDDVGECLADVGGFDELAARVAVLEPLSVPTVEGADFGCGPGEGHGRIVGMNYSERFESQDVIWQGEAEGLTNAKMEAQYAAVGRKVVELLRECPTISLTFRVDIKTEHHLEPDPSKPAPKVRHMLLNVVKHVGEEEATVLELHRLVAKLHRRVQELEKTSSPSPSTTS